MSDQTVFYYCDKWASFCVERIEEGYCYCLTSVAKGSDGAEWYTKVFISKTDAYNLSRALKFDLTGFEPFDAVAK